MDIHLFVSIFTHSFIYFFECMHVPSSMSQHTHGGQTTTHRGQFSSSSMWVLEIEFWLLGLATNTLACETISVTFLFIKQMLHLCSYAGLSYESCHIGLTKSFVGYNGLNFQDDSLCLYSYRSQRGAWISASWCTQKKWHINVVPLLAGPWQVQTFQVSSHETGHVTMHWKCFGLSLGQICNFPWCNAFLHICLISPPPLISASLGMSLTYKFWA